MDLAIEQQWEIIEATFVKRDECHELTDKIIVNIYDDDRDLLLTITAESDTLLEKTVGLINSEFPIEAMEFNDKEPDNHYFNIQSNPSQETMRNALRAVIPKMESIGLKLRKLEDTWV